MRYHHHDNTPSSVRRPNHESSIHHKRANANVCVLSHRRVLTSTANVILLTLIVINIVPAVRSLSSPCHIGHRTNRHCNRSNSHPTLSLSSCAYQIGRRKDSFGRQSIHYKNNHLRQYRCQCGNRGQNALYQHSPSLHHNNDNDDEPIAVHHNHETGIGIKNPNGMRPSLIHTKGTTIRQSCSATNSPLLPPPQRLFTRGDNRCHRMPTLRAKPLDDDGEHGEHERDACRLESSETGSSDESRDYGGEGEKESYRRTTTSNSSTRTNDTDDHNDNDDRPVYRSRLQLQSGGVGSRTRKGSLRRKGPYRPSVSLEKTPKQKLTAGIPPINSPLNDLPPSSRPTKTPSPPTNARRIQNKPKQQQRPTKPKRTISSSHPKPKPSPTSPQTVHRHEEAEEEYLIDAFLRGVEPDLPLTLHNEDTPAPHPGLTPGDTVEIALRALRGTPSSSSYSCDGHGAAVFLTFCTKLSRNDRWGGGVASSSSSSYSSSSRGRGGTTTATAATWKEILRGALTPTMFVRRLRAFDEFSGLLDWERIDVTDGMALNPRYSDGGGGGGGGRGGQALGVDSTVAFVNAAMFFGDGFEPSIVQFMLVRRSGVWLIDTAVVSKKEWFMDDDDDEEEEEEEGNE